MKTNRCFNVFGDPVEVLIESKATGNSYCAITQAPFSTGGGPPPHIHQNEDETFVVLEGEFELFDGENWHKLTQGESRQAPRGHLHTFRSCCANGKILCIAMPGGLDEYLEAISQLVMPQDLARLKTISDEYGITFVTPEPPQAPPI